MTRAQVKETHQALAAKGYEAVHAHGKGGGFWIRKDGRTEYVSAKRAREVAGLPPLPKKMRQPRFRTAGDLGFVAALNRRLARDRKEVAS
jgi:hypothetical protein